MTDVAVDIDGAPVQSLTLHVPGCGLWFVVAQMVGDELKLTSEPKTLRIGPFSARGTIEPAHDSAFAGERRTRLVAGADGWRNNLTTQPYRNDAGVTAIDVARDAARAVGETLGSFDGGQQTLGIKYVRQAAVASATLEDVARGVPWWVDFAGVTHVGKRTSPAPPKSGSVTLLNYDPELACATLVTDDLTQINIGTVITDERLSAPITIASYEVRITQENLRIIAWCAQSQSPLVDALRGIVARSLSSKLFGKYRYRVTTLEVDRVNVQATSQADGLPDILSLEMSPGVAGMHARLALGAEVFVEFIAGDRADPQITGFTGKGGKGFVPQAIIIGAPTEADAANVARQGDGVELVFPPFTLTGTMFVNGVTPTPFTAVGFGSTGKLEGAITGGSTHGVKSG